MTNNSQEWALITGASGGIGLELARLFAQDGINIVLAARSQPLLEQHAQTLHTQQGVNVLPVTCDLSQLDGIQTLTQTIADRHITITYLVNNAGAGLFGKFQETDLAREQNMIYLNCLALTTLTKHFLPPMLAQQKGYILNIASTAAFQPGPYQSVYFATKAFVLSFSEAISEELKHSGVQITALCPGLTETGFVRRANMTHSNFVKHNKAASPQSVAAAGYRALFQHQRVVVPGFINWLNTLGPRVLPRRWLTVIVARMMTPSSPH